MLKFVVVLYRRADLSPEQFHENLRREHGSLAERLPGLRRYIQNHVAPSPNRPHPGWDAVVELFWDDRAAMEAAWKTPEGQRATSHLAEFVDLSASSTSSMARLPGGGMLYMLVEHFREADPVPVYRRFREQGRMAPEGLRYIGSWVTEDLGRCFQVMECDDPALLTRWMARWEDLIAFEVIPVITSAEALAVVTPRL